MASIFRASPSSERPAPRPVIPSTGSPPTPAAPALAGLGGCCVFAVGSDGTDGPTDAAGGYADGEALAALTAAGLDVPHALADNDAYHALQAVGGLIVTGPTGTNVNDVAVVLTE